MTVDTLTLDRYIMTAVATSLDILTYYKLRKREPSITLGSHQEGESYILTYYKLRKREPLIAQGSHKGGGGLIYVSVAPPTQGWKKQSMKRLTLSLRSMFGCMFAIHVVHIQSNIYIYIIYIYTYIYIYIYNIIIKFWNPFF